MRSRLILVAIAACSAWFSVPAFAQTTDTAPVAFDDEILNSKRNMMSGPATALDHARAAEDVARAGPISPEQSIAIATAYWLQAEALNRLNEPNDAAPLVQRALGLLGPSSGDTKLKGDLILAQGRIARVLRDDELALKSFHTAHDIFVSLEQTRYQAIALQSLGSIYLDARDYKRALDFYERASEAHQGDPALDLASFNNRAQTHREIGHYGQSIELYTAAFGLAESLDSPMLKARTKSNIALSHLLTGDFEQALIDVEDSVSFIEETDASEWRPIILGVKGQVLGAMGDHKAAVQIFNLVFAGQDLTQTNTTYRDLHRAAYESYRNLENSAKALVHLEAFKRLDDSARDLAASANNVLVAAEFDFATQELEIVKLNAAQLRNSIALERSATQQQRLILIAGALFAVTIAIALGWGLFQTRASNARIAKVNASLEKTNTALDQANQVKTAFLATTSHELRTPLNGVLGIAQVMLADDGLSDEQRENVESIRGAGDSLLAVVSDILDVATIESGKFEITNSATNIAKIANDVNDLFRVTADDKNITLQVDMGDCPTTLMSDAMRMRQLLVNLVSNAVKFTESGSVQVHFKTLLQDGGEWLRIEVRDTGIGIPTDQLEAVFEPFHQVENGRTRRFGGTGLGLSICRKICRALNGNISVQSQVGHGTQFEIILPLNRLAPQTPDQDAGNERKIQSVADLDVLVVEDNLLNRTVIKALIDTRVASVTLAEDGVEALAALQERRFDLILMDKQMPNMDGITATKTIRAMTNGAENIYITAVTADAYDGAREELLECGMDDYLAKPVDADTLHDALQWAVDRGLRHQTRKGEAA